MRPPRVQRQFQADRPDVLWVADFTYVSTWQGFVYVAFVVEVFARRLVGGRVSVSARTDFVLEALEQALYARRPQGSTGLIHHRDRGVQYVSIRDTERLAETGIEPSVGRVARLGSLVRWWIELIDTHYRSRKQRAFQKDSSTD